jgi:hypothetical protein
VVHRRLRLALAAACGLYGMLCTRVACSLIDATTVVSCGLLVALFVPLLSGHGTLLSTLDGDAGQRFPTAAQGWSKLGHLGAGSVMGGDTTPLFGSALGSIGRRVERSQQCPVMCVTFGHHCQCPPGVMVGPPSSTTLVVAWVLHHKM